MCTLRFQGVRIALPWRSGTALMDYKQNGIEVSVTSRISSNQEYSLASVCEKDYAENFWLPQTMARPKAFFAPCSVSLQNYAGSINSNFYLLHQHIYKPACCSIDIVKEILIHVCAFDLNCVLFAFVIFKICRSFFIYFHQNNTIGRCK